CHGVCPHQKRHCHEHEKWPAFHSLRFGGGPRQTEGRTPTTPVSRFKLTQPACTSPGTLPVRADRWLNSYADWACEIYGIRRWCDTYNPRQLLSLVTLVECLADTC